MLLELTDATSTNPDFAAPKRRNGEELTLFSVAVQGQFMVLRYLGWEPVEGPAVDRFFLDLYYNQYGREVFRVTVKVVEPPPPPLTFGNKLRRAFRSIFEQQQ
jgi:hypothetical protein